MEKQLLHVYLSTGGKPICVFINVEGNLISRKENIKTEIKRMLINGFEDYGKVFYSPHVIMKIKIIE